MGISLTREEHAVVQELQNSGMSAPAATLATVMLSRGHVRLERELADIVGQYPNLEGDGVAERTITELRRRGWLVRTEHMGLHLTGKAADLQNKIEQQVHNPRIMQELINSMSVHSLLPNIRILGKMTEPDIYASYVHLLQNSQREVCLPMLATSPNLSVVSILRERARRGVHVRILLGSPNVAERLRGATVAKKSRESIDGWIHNAKGIPRMEVRIAHSVEDMLFATSWTVDGHLLRFDIYDPAKQRSLEGVMVEIISPVGLNLNIIQLFQTHFDEAWKHAEPTHLWGKIHWRFGRGWQWWAFAASTIIAFVLSKNTIWSGIAISVAATFFVNALVTSWPTIRSSIRRQFVDE